VTPYWLLFLYFAAAALLERDDHDFETRATNRTPLLLMGGLIIALMIGLRFRVSADWPIYNDMFEDSRRLSLGSSIARISDPAYALLNWGISHGGGEFWMVNTVCGLIFAWGLIRFAGAQANPWLALLTAIPYLVIVVAMGYSRQSVAIGIVLAGLAAVARGGSTLRFAVYVAAAALFHKTAVMMLPLVAFAQERNRLTNLVTGLAVLVLFYDLFLSNSISRLYRNYIDLEGSSQGAGIRVTLNAIPAVLYLINRRSFAFSLVETRLAFNFSVAALLFVPLLLISPSSTAVDRMALYIIPLQLVLWSRMHMAYNLGNVGRAIIVAFAATVLFTWLNFAVHAHFWIPYKLYPVFS
jgi:hypothetical protein